MNPYFIEMMMDEMKIFSDINDEYVSEATTYSVLDEISSFFSRLLNDLISFGKRVKEDVKAIIQKKSVNIRLKQLKKELQEQKGEGVKKVKMVDVDEYIETFKSYEKEVVKKVNKLIDGNFKRRDKIITKSDELESLIEQMNSDLDYILKNKVTVSINDAIRYVEENISGKSNISDCIRWILGEQSMKSLRGAKSEDIIFAGTQNRKSLGFAEASLIFDNTDGTLPIEYSEVTITRKRELSLRPI